MRMPRCICPYQITTISKDITELYEKKKSNIVHVGSLEDRHLYIRDADIIKQICTNTKSVDKPVEIYSLLSFWGPNIITTTGNDWRKHRHHCNPAFSDFNIRSVTECSVKKVLELFTTWDETGLLDIDTNTLKFTLSVICGAAFGKEIYIDLRPDEFDVNKHKMSFSNSISIVSSNCAIRFLCSDLVFDMLPFDSMKKIKSAFEELTSYMNEIVIERKSGADGSKRDILSLLLKAQKESEGGLTDEEIIADIFIFLLAGHETTAHTLNFALRLLALYPDFQEKLHQDTVSVIGSKIPCYEDINNLTMAWNVFKETLRLFPAATVIPKKISKGMKLGSHFIPAGTILNLDFYNLHRNPDYWSNPNEFNPNRWNCNTDIGTQVPHYFIPFSYGQRSCIGRKFAETESIIFLAMLSQNYKWKIQTTDANKNLLDWSTLITTQPVEHVKFIVERR
jgi:cytochrome P450